MTFRACLIAGLIAAWCSSALAERLKCEDVASGLKNAGDLTKEADKYSVVFSMALGAYLASKNKIYSNIDQQERTDAMLAYYEYCRNHPAEDAMDAAILAAVKPSTTTTALTQTEQPKKTITSADLASALSANRTELEQEDWWKANMAGRVLEFTGKVRDVENGTFSGYWISLDIGHNIRIRCGLSDKWKPVATKLRKGQNFTCKGEVSGTWVALFGIVFDVDAG